MREAAEVERAEWEGLAVAFQLAHDPDAGHANVARSHADEVLRELVERLRRLVRRLFKRKHSGATQDSSSGSRVCWAARSMTSPTFSTRPAPRARSSS